jgi:hypothetical protein
MWELDHDGRVRRVSRHRLRRMLEKGELDGTERVRERNGEWRALRDVDEFRNAVRNPLVTAANADM